MNPTNLWQKAEETFKATKICQAPRWPKEVTIFKWSSSVESGFSACFLGFCQLSWKVKKPKPGQTCPKCSEVSCCSGPQKVWQPVSSREWLLQMWDEFETLASNGHQEPLCWHRSGTFEVKWAEASCEGPVEEKLWLQPTAQLQWVCVNNSRQETIDPYIPPLQQEVRSLTVFIIYQSDTIFLKHHGNHPSPLSEPPGRKWGQHFDAALHPLVLLPKQLCSNPHDLWWSLHPHFLSSYFKVIFIHSAPQHRRFSLSAKTRLFAHLRTGPGTPRSETATTHIKNRQPKFPASAKWQGQNYGSRETAGTPKSHGTPTTIFIASLGLMNPTYMHYATTIHPKCMPKTNTPLLIWHCNTIQHNLYCMCCICMYMYVCAYIQCITTLTIAQHYIYTYKIFLS